jgi:hypothetical protein
MSYAAVAAENAPPLSQQPRPDPALLNTTPPTHSNVVNDTLKLNIVGPDFKEHPASETPRINEDYKPPEASKPKKGLEDESRDFWGVTKYYLFRPGIAGGLIGISTCIYSYVLLSNSIEQLILEYLPPWAIPSILDPTCVTTLPLFLLQ